MIFLFSSEKSILVTDVTHVTLNVMRQSACLVFNPILVDYYKLPSLIARRWVGRQTL